MSLIDDADNASAAPAIDGFSARRSLDVSSFMLPTKRYAAASSTDAIHTAMFTRAPRRRLRANKVGPNGCTCESRISPGQPFQLVDASINLPVFNVMRQLNWLHRGCSAATQAVTPRQLPHAVARLTVDG